MPEELLEALDLWAAKAVQALVVRARTNEYYRQQKFNLLHEETEGYAKLIDALHSAFAAQQSPASSPALLGQRVTALIGYFDLDPNRVVDLLLSIYHPLASSHNLPVFLSLLPLFNPAHVSQIAGFKCQQYAQAGEALPVTFVDVLACLIREGRMDVEAVWSHLTPSDEELVRVRTEWLVDETAKASKVGMASLVGAEEKREEKEEKKEPARDVTKEPAQNRNEAGLVMGEPLVSVPPSLVLTQPAPLPSSPFTPQQSGKFLLLASLIAAHAWPHAERVLGFMRALDPVSHPAVSAALCTYVQLLIEPFMTAISSPFRVLRGSGAGKGGGLRDVTVDVAVDDDALLALPAVLQPALSLLGHFLHTDPVLFTQLCRLFSHVLTSHKKRHTGPAVAYEPPPVLSSLITSTLIPAYTLLPSAVSYCSALWTVLSLLPYPVRFRVYGEWHRSLASSHLYLQVAHDVVVQKTKYFRKRISSAKVKECSRLLLKFALSGPSWVFALVLAQLQAVSWHCTPLTQPQR